MLGQDGRYLENAKRNENFNDLKVHDYPSCRRVARRHSGFHTLPLSLSSWKLQIEVEKLNYQKSQLLSEVETMQNELLSFLDNSDIAEDDYRSVYLCRLSLVFVSIKYG